MKKRATTINGSQTFIFKSRCKFCKSGPKYVYYLLNKMVSTDTLYMIKDFYEGAGKNSSVADDYYIDYTVKNRTFVPSYMFDSRSSSLQKLPVPNMRYQQNEDRFGTVVECSCGKTSWGYVRSNRKHITNRQCTIKISLKEIDSMYRFVF